MEGYKMETGMGHGICHIHLCAVIIFETFSECDRVMQIRNTALAISSVGTLSVMSLSIRLEQTHDRGT